VAKEASRKPLTPKRMTGLASGLLLVGIVVLANIVGATLFRRVDLTEGRMYSLNAASKNLVRKLDDTFLVKAYFSKNLPSPYNANARYLQDLLEEYRVYGKGRFRFEFVDPADDAKLEEEAQKHRIPPVQVQVLEREQFQAKKAYMGVVFMYKDRQETIPIVENPVGLEYDITSTIKKMTRASEDLPVVGILSGHEEPEFSDLSTVQQVFEKQYRLRPVTVSNGQRVPPDVSVLLIASPRRPLSEWEKYAIDQYIMRGGKVAFLIDKVNADLQMGRAFPLRLQLDDWCQNYGFKVNDNLVGDFESPGVLNVTQQQGFFRMVSQVPYPLIPSLRGFNRSNIMVKDLERISLFFASSIDTSVARAKGLHVEPLVYTSPKSMIQEGGFNIDPVQRWKKEDFDRGQQVVAAVVSGVFTSYFKDKPVPAPSDSGAAAAAPTPKDSTITHSPETRLVVVGDGEFFVDSKGGGERDNLLFFQNLVDWLVQDEDLIAIRSREVTDRPLRNLSEPAKRLVKYANMAGSPALVIVGGLILWQVRRRRKVEI
jgi:gliding motility-associatede transport system auxiliary component